MSDHTVTDNKQTLINAEQEIKQLKNRIARLEGALLSVCQEYVAEIDAKYPKENLVYPSMQRSKNQDMVIIDECDSIFSESSNQSLAEIQADAVEEASNIKFYVVMNEPAIMRSDLLNYAEKIRNSVKEGE